MSSLSAKTKASQGWWRSHAQRIRAKCSARPELLSFAISCARFHTQPRGGARGAPSLGEMVTPCWALHAHDAPLPLRADRVFGFPVDHESGRCEAVPRLALPNLVGRHRANQVDPVLGPTRQEVVGGHIARINQLFPRGHLAGGQMSLNGGQHGKIGGRGRCGRHIGDQVWCRVVTGFGDMHFVARPFRLALFAIAGLRVIREADQQQCWGQIVRAAPAHRLVMWSRVELLQPHLPQSLDGGEIPQPGGGGRIIDGPQQLVTVRPHLLGQGIAGRLLRRQAIFRKPLAVAIEPHRWHPRLEPVWRGGGQHIERMPKRFADALQPIKRLGRALAAFGLHQPLFAKQR